MDKHLGSEEKEHAEVLWQLDTNTRVVRAQTKAEQEAVEFPKRHTSWALEALEWAHHFPSCYREPLTSVK